MRFLLLSPHAKGVMIKATAYFIIGYSVLEIGYSVVCSPGRKPELRTYRRTTVKRTFIRLLIVLIVCACDAASQSRQTGIPIRSMTDWKIVVPAHAIPSEGYAAEELQTFFEEATGIRLPITTEPGEAVKCIYVGPGRVMKASVVGFDTTEFGPEALRVVVGKSSIGIAGGRPRGTLYGVYTLEKAMASTADDAIRDRLEKETIGCYGVFVDPVTSAANGKIIGQIKKRDDGTPFTLNPQDAKFAQPHLAKFFALCRKHGVNQYSERVSMNRIEQMLRQGYKLGDNGDFAPKK